MSTEEQKTMADDVLAMYDADDRQLMRTIAESKTPGVSRAVEIAGRR